VYLMGAIAAGPLIDELDILEVWTAAGGAPLKGTRGRAFWRDGDGYNVAIDRAKGVWYDQRDHVGGGIVKLVQTARDCDRETARAWLGELFGVTTGNSYTPEERRAYIRRMEVARKLAAVIETRRQAELDRVRLQEREALDEYHRLDREAHEKQDIDILVDAMRKWQAVEEFTRLRDLLSSSNGPELLRVFQMIESEAA
jgi:hypothetical protein